MAHIWLDITTIKGWQRPPVGVVRVEAECCRYLLAHGGASVRFCWFERANRRYVELPREAAAQILAQRAAPSITETATLRMTAAGRAKHLARRVIWMLPARHQEILWLKYKDGLSYKEIGDVMGISPSNAGFILSEATSNKIPLVSILPSVISLLRISGVPSASLIFEINMPNCSSVYKDDSTLKPIWLNPALVGTAWGMSYILSLFIQ